VNRYSGIVISPGRAEVRYVLDMAEIPTFQEMPRIDTDGDGAAGDRERQVWADREAVEMLSDVSLTVDGRPLSLRVVSDAMRFRPGQAGLPILYLTARFSGPLSAASGSVEYRDDNFPGRIGWKEITARSESGVAVAGSTVPATSISRELLAYPKDLLSSPLDVTSAGFRFLPGQPGPPSGSERSGPTVPGAPIASGAAFAGLVAWRLTPLLLVASLLLAFLFGAVHALGPGHGKTITAAYLVGSGARAGQAVAVGAAVALMHTASVLSLGLLLFVLARTFPVEQVYPWLTLTTGLVALGLGAGLFVTRLRARRAKLDPGHGHTHMWDPPAGDRHDSSHPHRGGGRHTHGLVGLALAGGILPSPTAFVVLTGSISAHRVGYGLALIVTFSLGLAAALILVGFLALRARAVVERNLHRRLALLLPLISALVIVGFGLFFATRGLSQLA